jgi:hypothetical protein
VVRGEVRARWVRLCRSSRRKAVSELKKSAVSYRVRAAHTLGQGSSESGIRCANARVFLRTRVRVSESV